MTIVIGNERCENVSKNSIERILSERLQSLMKNVLDVSVFDNDGNAINTEITIKLDDKEQYWCSNADVVRLGRYGRQSIV